MIPKAIDFENELKKVFNAGETQGKQYVEVKSGDLHKKVGGYPSNNHRMPICCSVMRKFMNENDEIKYAPPSGQGATLTIHYKLPR